MEHDVEIKRVKQDMETRLESMKQSNEQQMQEMSQEHNSKIKHLLREMNAKMAAKEQETQQIVQEAISKTCVGKLFTNLFVLILPIIWLLNLKENSIV